MGTTKWWQDSNSGGGKGQSNVRTFYLVLTFILYMSQDQLQCRIDFLAVRDGNISCWSQYSVHFGGSGCVNPKILKCVVKSV